MRRPRWVLHAVEVHGLYKKFGFAPPNARLMERQAPG